MKKPFNIQMNGRRRHFATLAEAQAYCDTVFAETGWILGIERSA